VASVGSNRTPYLILLDLNLLRLLLDLRASRTTSSSTTTKVKITPLCRILLKTAGFLNFQGGHYVPGAATAACLFSVGEKERRLLSGLVKLLLKAHWSVFPENHPSFD
jgi:hypothetical protein